MPLRQSFNSGRLVDTGANISKSLNTLGKTIGGIDEENRRADEVAAALQLKKERNALIDARAAASTARAISRDKVMDARYKAKLALDKTALELKTKRDLEDRTRATTLYNLKMDEVKAATDKANFSAVPLEDLNDTQKDNMLRENPMYLQTTELTGRNGSGKVPINFDPDDVNSLAPALAPEYTNPAFENTDTSIVDEQGAFTPTFSLGELDDNATNKESFLGRGQQRENERAQALKATRVDVNGKTVPLFSQEEALTRANKLFPDKMNKTEELAFKEINNLKAEKSKWSTAKAKLINGSTPAEAGLEDKGLKRQNTYGTQAAYEDAVIKAVNTATKTLKDEPKISSSVMKEVHKIRAKGIKAGASPEVIADEIRTSLDISSSTMGFGGGDYSVNSKESFNNATKVIIGNTDNKPTDVKSWLAEIEKQEALIDNKMSVFSPAISGRKTDVSLNKIDEAPVKQSVREYWDNMNKPVTPVSVKDTTSVADVANPITSKLEQLKIEPNITKVLKQEDKPALVKTLSELPEKDFQTYIQSLPPKTALAVLDIVDPYSGGGSYLDRVGTFASSIGEDFSSAFEASYDVNRAERQQNSDRRSSDVLVDKTRPTQSYLPETWFQNKLDTQKKKNFYDNIVQMRKAINNR